MKGVARAALVLVTASIGIMGCDALLGIADLPALPDAGTTLPVADAADAPPSPIGSSACAGKTMCDGGCVDLALTSTSCGACGHNCQGGECGSGHCRPVVLATGSTPSELAVSDASISWITGASTPSSAIMTCGLPACAEAGVLTEGQKGITALLTSDATRVYWAQPGMNGAVLACPFTGCDLPMVVAGSQPDPSGIAADDTGVYFTIAGSAAGGEVRACPLAGCVGPPTVLASGQPLPSNLVVADGFLYWANQNEGTIKRCATTCNNDAMTVAAVGGSVGAIAVRGQRMYFSVLDGAGQIYVCPVTGCPTSGPELFASEQPYVRHLLAIGDDVFWGGGAGVFVCRNVVSGAGCGAGPTLLVADTFVAGLGADALNLYFSGSGGDGGKLQRLAK